MNTILVEKFNRLLTRRRLSYAWIAGGALWIAWLLSVFTGAKGFDRAGQVIGTDFIQFYAAGKTLLREDSALLYDFTYQSSLEQEITGPGLKSFHAFITPPLLAVVFIPFALLPYTASFILWSLLGLYFLWLSLKLISPHNSKTLFSWSILWFPVFASISFGQNSLLSLVILSLAYVFWKQERYLLCGMFTSLLFYKPQLIIGLGVLWLMDVSKYRKALSGFLFGSAIIIALNVALFPEASASYWNFITSDLPRMLSQDQFPIWHMHTIRGFWSMLFRGSEVFADILYILSIVFILAGFIRIFKHQHQNRIHMYSAAVILTILITPHAMIYDWSILLIPAVLLWNASDTSKALLKALFAMMWIGAFLSGPLSFLQLEYFHRAIQISIPMLVLASFALYKYFLTQTNRGTIILETNADLKGNS